MPTRFAGAPGMARIASGSRAVTFGSRSFSGTDTGTLDARGTFPCHRQRKRRAQTEPGLQREFGARQRRIAAPMIATRRALRCSSRFGVTAAPVTREEHRTPVTRPGQREVRITPTGRRYPPPRTPATPAMTATGHRERSWPGRAC